MTATVGSRGAWAADGQDPSDGTFEVRAQLAQGAAVVGVWTSRKAADRKLAEWVELYGSAVVEMTIYPAEDPPATVA